MASQGENAVNNTITTTTITTTTITTNTTTGSTTTTTNTNTTTTTTTDSGPATNDVNNGSRQVPSTRWPGFPFREGPIEVDLGLDGVVDLVYL
ncbi:uncharacterized protein FIESC28_06761 [Fusarium coffeatum]|uniref:Uncharacterized protein n=1 Tax=Fusarium coffeatum TaxID=231269 RepID=A0A366RKB2_9HYPO|nr:uncharacterized protein FIESC28_06761 [Fusarium coffeatum]RBR16846.1 hypothetical protein FIESC28_06761 [Fusarium coffeatum]